MNAQDTLYFNASMPLHQVEKWWILRTLREMRGNKTQTAYALGISVRTLDNKLQAYGEESKEDERKESKRRFEAENFQRRSRGLPPLEEHGIQTESGPGYEPASQASTESHVSVQEREEVQEVPLRQVANHSKHKRR
jgi:hypothetical protein